MTDPGPNIAPKTKERTAKGKRPALKARAAAVGIGAAAMAGLVANMEVASGQVPATPATAAGPSPLTSELGYQRLAALQKARAARPIVLTPHVIVHTIGGGPAPAVSAGGYVSSGYAAAPAPVYRAAAPVARSGGSRP